MIETLKSQALNKINKFKDKIKNARSLSEELEYKKQITKLENDLNRELNCITDDTSIKKTEMDFENFSSKDENFYTFNNILIPKDAYVYLFDFQKDGLKWFLGKWTKKEGGILADEMGMGKTVQIIVFFSILFYNNLIERILILCPLSIVLQWESEVNKIYKKIGLTKPKIYLKELPGKNKRGIFIFNYEYFKSNNKRSIEIKDSSLISMNYDCVFLDEGHKIKNKNSQISKICKNIVATCKFVVSGTPIQNNLLELWSIFEFIDPQILGNLLEFKSEYVDAIKGNNNRSIRMSQELKSIIDPYILRRLKSQVKSQLPSKKDKVLFTALTQIQNNLYFEILDMINTTKRFNDKSLFRGIDLLRKICNHPALVNLEENIASRYSPHNNLIESSCKLIALFNLLEKWYSLKNRVLIFTQTIQMQDIIERAFKIHNEDNSYEIKYLKMNGTMSQIDRKLTVDKFNDDRRILCFLLTTKVGGLGLNLVGADRIIIYDPDWNPTIDSQAKERIYRYGQKQDVEIYRFICRNTVEEKIYQKQIFKDCLSKRVLSNPMVFIKKDIMELFLYGIPLNKSVSIELDKNYIEPDKLQKEDFFQTNE